MFTYKCAMGGGGKKSKFKFAHFAAISGSFLIAYSVLMIVVGIPMMAVETSIGQMYKTAPVQVMKRLSPPPIAGEKRHSLKRTCWKYMKFRNTFFSNIKCIQALVCQWCWYRWLGRCTIIWSQCGCCAICGRHWLSAWILLIMILNAKCRGCIATIRGIRKVGVHTFVVN